MVKKVSKDALMQYHPSAFVPLEYVGQWVAWTHDQSQVVAHGTDLARVHNDAIAAGHPDAILEMVRRPGIFIGEI